jgi:hypothetical protein
MKDLTTIIPKRVNRIETTIGVKRVKKLEIIIKWERATWQLDKH